MDLYREFMNLVREYQITPSSLKLEITETAVMMDVPKQVALIERLQAEGFIVEMDDFGSGYSSLNTLKDMKDLIDNFASYSFKAGTLITLYLLFLNFSES